MKITDFVVGLGFDTSDFDKGIKGATQQIGSFKSSVLQAGAALGMAFTFKGLTFDFAKQTNQTRQMADYLGISATKLAAMQNVAQHFGADIGELSGLLTGFNQAKAGISVGQIGVFQDLAKAGVSIDPLIQAKDATEMLLRLSEQMGRLGHNQRSNVAKTLGLSPAMLDVLAKGRKRLEELRKEYAEIRPVTEKAQKASMEWQAGLTELTARVGRYSDKISTGLVAGLDAVVNKTNAWIRANQGLLDSGFDKAAKLIEDNVEAIGVALGALTAGGALVGLGKIAGSLGGIGKAASGALVSVGRLGGVIGFLASLAFVNPEDIFGEKIGKFLNLKPGELVDWFSGKREEIRKKGVGALQDETPEGLPSAAVTEMPEGMGAYESLPSAAEEQRTYEDVATSGAAVSAPPSTSALSGSSTSAPVEKPMPTRESIKQGVAQINNSVVVKIGNESIRRVVRKEVGDVFKVGGAKFSVGADL